MIGPRKVDKPLVLYGYGKLGHLAEEIFNKLGIKILYILDKQQKKAISIPNGETKASYFISLMNQSLLAICITTEPYQVIVTPLISAGWIDICSVYDIFEAYPECGIGSGWFTGELTEEEKLNIISIVYGFNDLLSRKSYNFFCEWHQNRKEIDVPIEPCKFLPSTLADIQKRQYPIYFSEDYLHEFRKADIHCEGYELRTVEENIFCLQKYRPLISCACYHSRDGLWKIEKALMDGLPNYKWTFRLHAYQGQGAVIYGVPEERK
jgi:hypothetical protein